MSKLTGSSEYNLDPALGWDFKVRNENILYSGSLDNPDSINNYNLAYNLPKILGYIPVVGLVTGISKLVEIRRAEKTPTELKTANIATCILEIGRQPDEFYKKNVNTKGLRKARAIAEMCCLGPLLLIGDAFKSLYDYTTVKRGKKKSKQFMSVDEK